MGPRTHNGNPGITAGILIAYNASGHNSVTQAARVANIKFLTTNARTFINMDSIPDARIDHCVFDGTNRSKMYMVAMDSMYSDPSVATTGVIDHCNFISGDYAVHVGPRLWIDNKELGTGDAVFVEDCYFVDFHHPVSGFNGAHWVFRNNYVIGLNKGYGIDAHGPVFESLGGVGTDQIHGTNLTETYNNYFDSLPNVQADGDDNWGALRLRSGRGVIWGNTFRNHRHAGIFTEDRRTCSNDGLDAPHEFYIWDNVMINITKELWWNDGLGCNPTFIKFEKGGIAVDTQMPGYTPYPYPHPLTQARK